GAEGRLLGGREQVEKQAVYTPDEVTGARDPGAVGARLGTRGEKLEIAPPARTGQLHEERPTGYVAHASRHLRPRGSRLFRLLHHAEERRAPIVLPVWPHPSVDVADRLAHAHFVTEGDGGADERLLDARDGA